MSEWIDWDGGECPVEKGVDVEVLLRNGIHRGDITNPVALCWKHEGVGQDIIQYKILGEKPQSLRYNEGKAELSYILDADYAIEGACEVMSFGATKYDRNNWKKGFPKEKLMDSLLRHAIKFQNGEELDEESGLPHVDHLLCNAIFLAYHFNGRKSEDE